MFEYSMSLSPRNQPNVESSILFWWFDPIK